MFSTRLFYLRRWHFALCPHCHKWLWANRGQAVMDYRLLPHKRRYWHNACFGSTIAH